MEDTRKAGGTMTPQHQTPSTPAFDSTVKLWKDYLLRFETFANVNSVPDEKKALVFLTNMISGTYKLITNYASQQDVPKTVNAGICNSVTLLISCQVTIRPDAVHCEGTIQVLEHHIKRKPGETSSELTARIRQMATTCDFPVIKNPLDEAMRTCFICAINSEAILISPCSMRRKRSWRSRRP